MLGSVHTSYINVFMQSYKGYWPVKLKALKRCLFTSIPTTERERGLKVMPKMIMHILQLEQVEIVGRNLDF